MGTTILERYDGSAIDESKDYIITLKEITDLLDVRHNDAMKKIRELAKESDFGLLREIRKTPESGVGRPFTTYILTKTQAIAAGAKLNDKLLMKLVKYVESVEKKRQPREMSDMELVSRALIISSKTIKQLEEKMEKDRPYIQYAKTIATNDVDISIRRWVELMHGELGLPDDVGEQMVINFLIEKEMLYRYGGKKKKLTAHSKWVKTRHFNVTRGANVSSPENPNGYSRLQITPKGRDAISPRIIEYMKSLTKDERAKYKNRRNAS